MTEQKSYIDKDGEALEIDEQWFKGAKRGRPAVLNKKQPVTIRLDPDIISHFKTNFGDNDNEKGWQTRMNAALRKAAGLA